MNISPIILVDFRIMLVNFCNHAWEFVKHTLKHAHL